MYSCHSEKRDTARLHLVDNAPPVGATEEERSMNTELKQTIKELGARLDQLKVYL